MEKHIIWEEEIGDLKDWDVDEEMRENNLDPQDESKKREYVQELNAEYRNDEVANLDIEVNGEIIAFGRAGLWDGTSLQVGRTNKNNIGKIILESPYSGLCYEEYYCEDGDMYYSGAHHDGRNTVMYRILPEGEDYDEFIEELNNTSSQKEFDEVVRKRTLSLAPFVASAYGW